MLQELALTDVLLTSSLNLSTQVVSLRDVAPIMDKLHREIAQLAKELQSWAVMLQSHSQESSSWKLMPTRLSHAVKLDNYHQKLYFQ